ncbi:hypothetical protein CYMTET_34015 [Cymbomonas tetramitiformis]|uniref:Uncharacterized protein n=1 Tax=Cymbomonas tetramitiformis TaxID=36881 RepID=A0AAE0FBV7_9CHLO|nr:hypothetical protein CYMTET_34015 [Cymbomonas tetramitiformis]
MSTSVFAWNIPYDVAANGNDLKELFEVVGPVEQFTLIKKPQNSFSSARFKYADHETALKAVLKYNGWKLDNASRVLRVKIDSAHSPAGSILDAASKEVPSTETWPASANSKLSEEVSQLVSADTKSESALDSSALKPLYPRKPCIEFHQEGKCGRGDKCVFSHGEDELASALPTQRQLASSKPAREGQIKVGSKYKPRAASSKRKQCKFWVLNGECPHGSKCRFAHRDTEPQQKVLPIKPSIEGGSLTTAIKHDSPFLSSQGTKVIRVRVDAVPYIIGEVSHSRWPHNAHAQPFFNHIR